MTTELLAWCLLGLGHAIIYFLVRRLYWTNMLWKAGWVRDGLTSWRLPNTGVQYGSFWDAVNYEVEVRPNRVELTREDEWAFDIEEQPAPKDEPRQMYSWREDDIQGEGSCEGHIWQADDSCVQGKVL
jgi:hypothetical protein